MMTLYQVHSFFCIVLTDTKLAAFKTGHVKLAPLPKREPGKPRPQREAMILAQTCAAQCINYSEILRDSDSKPDWFKCKDLTAVSGDACPVRSWVFFRSTVGLSFF